MEQAFADVTVVGQFGQNPKAIGRGKPMRHPSAACRPAVRVCRGAIGRQATCKDQTSAMRDRLP